MKVITPNKIFNIPQTLLNDYADSIIHNETVFTLQESLGSTREELQKKVRDALEIERKAHKAIFDHLNLDYEKRERGTDEGFIAEAVNAFWLAKREGKPEPTEFTVTFN